MKIFSGTANKPLFDKIVEKVGCEGKVDISKFPDGEIHVKFEDNIRGKDVFLVQSMNIPVNDNLMELLIMIDAAKRASAHRITAVIPFYAYARQDRKEQPRVPITAKLVADLLTAAGANRILTMDLHSPQIQGFFNIPVDHLQAMPAFIWHLNELKHQNYLLPNADMDNLVVVAPDVGRSKVAVQYGKVLNCPIAIVSKERVNAEIVHSDILIGEVKGKTAIIIDDLSTTGGTLVSAAELVKKHGASCVIAGVTHNVLTGEGFKKIDRSLIDAMMVTNTVDGEKGHWYSEDANTNLQEFYSKKFKQIDVSDLFAKAIKAVHDNESVSSLFEV